jgi:putative membrane protein
VIVVMLVVFKDQFPTAAATWFVVGLVVVMAGSIQFYARWRRLRSERLAIAVEAGSGGSAS